jgi:hypothetical protein
LLRCQFDGHGGGGALERGHGLKLFIAGVEAIAARLSDGRAAG